MERIPVAVVGFGRFGRLHAQRLRSHPEFRLECVVDTSSDARASAEAQGFIALSDLDALPDHLRAATVTTPSDTHAEVAMRLMRRGLDVLVEKPLATSEADIEQLLAVARETGRILCVAHIERFNRKDVTFTDDGVMAFHRVAMARHPGRDAVLDLMVHDLDLAAYWLGLPPEENIHITAAELDEHGAEVQAVIADIPLRFRAGYGAPSSSSTIRCGVAGLAAHSFAPQPAQHGEDALTRQYSAFHECLCGNPSPIANGMAGAAAARRALAILRAL